MRDVPWLAEPCLGAPAPLEAEVDSALSDLKDLAAVGQGMVHAHDHHWERVGQASMSIAGRRCRVVRPGPTLRVVHQISGGVPGRRIEHPRRMLLALAFQGALTS